MDRAPKVGDVVIALVPEGMPTIPVKMLVLSQPCPDEKGLCRDKKPTHKMKVYNFTTNNTGYYWFTSLSLKNHITLVTETE